MIHSANPIAMSQQTLAAPRIHCRGIGVHSGQPATLTLRPAPANHGLVFIRTDLPTGQNIIPAHHGYISDTRLCTVLRNSHGATAATVEHLLAALAASNIDNAIIELDGPEVPIMDGSAAPFLLLIEMAGTVIQDAPRRWLVVDEPIRVADGLAWLELMPAKERSFDLTADYDHPAIPRQRITLKLSLATFKAEIARARTFGFVRDLEALRARGLALGSSLENSIGVGETGPINPEGLRMPNEYVRHKLLDLIGDLALAGMPILGAVRGERAGHRLNAMLVQKLLQTAGTAHIGPQPALMPVTDFASVAA